MVHAVELLQAMVVVTADSPPSPVARPPAKDVAAAAPRLVVVDTHKVPGDARDTNSPFDRL
jgi:hypothetical protein